MSSRHKVPLATSSCLSVRLVDLSERRATFFDHSSAKTDTEEECPRLAKVMEDEFERIYARNSLEYCKIPLCESQEDTL